ncbi:hypothetical protein SAMN05444360_10293 [Chryseobacterium carnipullorum]|uniref:hypothetical protein n=1 Tax=Chryseobacterium carnipullorum TaxID=1124835 RepID=UPI00091D30FC|nr:hypothetical protein [Chryseobacterium carnipullorum]SHL49395.1 hypothetical protein SAMN05444360_10293 [Chryseobacterium carnipullorum]
MKTFKIFLGTAFLLLLQSNYLFAQGCSDAGFCTVNSFQPNNNDSIKAYHNQIKTGIFFGKADNSISAFGGYIEYNRQLGEKFGFDVKLTSLAQSGNDVSTFGLSDLFLNANYRANEKLKFTLGAKVPLSDAGNSKDNIPLPMDYQSSLGTLDLIVGVGYKIKKLQLVAALQQPLTQNDNQFLASQYPASSELRGFLSTNKFKRSGDVLLRISYPLMIHSKIRLTPSLLQIYHLKNDRFTNQNNEELQINNSEGLTLNGNVYLDYEINRRNGIQLNMGVPFIVRKSRPDGLTRSFIANVEYRVKF